MQGLLSGIAMKHLTLPLLALSCLTLVSCVVTPSAPAIPDRPLSAEEQPMVGTWTDWVNVSGGPGLGLGRAVIQRAPDHSAVYTLSNVSGDRVYRRMFIRWEVVNGKLHETGGFGRDVYSDYTFTGPNYLEVNNESERLEWCRYSPSHQVNVAEVLARPMISVAEAKGAYAPAQSENPWLKMATDYATQGIVPEGWERRETPRCANCGNTIWDGAITGGSLCSGCRRGPTPWSSY